MKKICFIGGGNMASALIGGLIKANPLLQCVVVEPFVESRANLAALGAQVTALEAVSKEAIAGADAVVLAVKPQILKAVCAEVGALLHGELVVSIAAGVMTATIVRWLGGHARVVRTMPNTPSMIGMGMTGVLADSRVTKADADTVCALMNACGETVVVADEGMIDSITAVSGSGPAYVFHWIESMQAAAKALGFNEADSRRLVLSTLKGATALAEASSEPPGVLRERVTSKGGTTAAALNVMNERGVAAIFADALKAARDRGAELGRFLDET